MSKEQMRTHKPTWYVDSDERVYSHNQVNRHHVMHGAARFTGSILLKKLRDLPGFYPHLIVIDVHKELNKAVADPPIPNDNIINELIVVQRGIEVATSLDRLDANMDYLQRMAIRAGVLTENSTDAWDLLDNLQQQRPFIERGRVTLLQQ